MKRNPKKIIAIMALIVMIIACFTGCASRPSTAALKEEPSVVDKTATVELNPVIGAIMARRSVRKYLDKPVEHEKLLTLARCAINAPSGMNAQPWLVRVVEDQ